MMKLQQSFSALLAGVIFGVGLAVSQMVNPEKVLAFLNVAGEWDGSLLLVMASAIVVALFGFRWALGRPPLFSRQHHLPTATDIDYPLVVGGAIFGIGWGLAGYCPGPAIAGLASGSAEPWVFLVAMVAGSQLGGGVFSKPSANDETANPDRQPPDDQG